MPAYDGKYMLSLLLLSVNDMIGALSIGLLLAAFPFAS
jgi:hypothetical protein